MKRLALLACLWAGGACADPAAWHVTGAGPGELWLLGSVHYLRAGDYPLPDVVDDLYARADAIVMELDLDDLDPAGSQSTLVGAALLPPGRTLADTLTDEVYAQTRERAAALGVDVGMLKQFQPWLVAITMLDLGMGRLGYDPEHGLEQYLLGKAAADDKEVLGLETLEAQIGVFSGLSAAEQQNLLKQTLTELDAAGGEMDALVAAWRDGRLEPLAATLTEEFESFPDLYATLVANRNRNWIAGLEGLLEDSSSYLVVVGALHLVGNENVVDLLRERGLQVSRVR
jgi:hypothetical protein